MFNKQFIPTLDDIKNAEVTNLAQRLKENSDKETITKIIEWQERNLPFSIDRMNMFMLLHFFLIISILLLPIPENIKIILIPILGLLAFLDLMSVLPYILTVIVSIIVFFTLIFSYNCAVANRLFSLFHMIMLSIILGGIISLLSYLILNYRNIKSFQPDFKLGDIFKLSLSIDKILKYRLAICRDYAKLTAVLLLNMYPKNKIYFITIPNHVATAININNKLYVLDQKLPIFTIETWLASWKDKLNKKKLKADILEIIIDKKKVKAKKVDSKILSETKIPKLNMKIFKNEISDMLKIVGSSKNDHLHLIIPLRNYAFRFDNDPIIQFSLIKSFIIKLENEFCGNLSNISKIDIIQDSKDLILEIYTN